MSASPIIYTTPDCQVVPHPDSSGRDERLCYLNKILNTLPRKPV